MCPGGHSAQSLAQRASGPFLPTDRRAGLGLRNVAEGLESPEIQEPGGQSQGGGASIRPRVAGFMDTWCCWSKASPGDPQLPGILAARGSLSISPVRWGWQRINFLCYFNFAVFNLLFILIN